MKRKILSGLLALCLLLSTMASGAPPMQANETTNTEAAHNHEAGWNGKLLTLSSRKYYLQEDVEFDRATTIQVKGNTMLCLNGHKINAKGHQLQFIVQNGATFTICDCSNVFRQGYIGKDGLWHEGEPSEDADVTYPLQGGVITGNQSGAPMIMSAGSIHFESGNIAGNSTNGGNSSMIFAQTNGTLHMTGGNIIGNLAQAVTIAPNSKGSMNAGNIAYNQSCIYGAGVRLNGDNATFDLSGGSICQNTSTAEGGGIFVSDKGKLYLSGEPIIKNNVGIDGKNNIFGYRDLIYLKTPLSHKEPIGVSVANPDQAVLTSGWNTHMQDQDPSAYFYSEKQGYVILKNDSGEAAFAKRSAYPIHYKDVGEGEFSGTLPEDAPKEHVYGIATTLPIPTKSGYIFEGWYLDPTGTGDSITELEADTSEAVTVYAKWLKEMQAPTITAEPQNIELEYGVGGMLSVEAKSPTGDTLSYQWYQASDQSDTPTGTMIEGATSETLAISKETQPGNYYYYCVVTASRDGESQPTTSRVATVTVKKPLLQAPTIDTEPEDIVLAYGEEGSLTVKATSSTGDTLSYQWYQASDQSDTQTGTPIEGATSETLAVGQGAQPGNYYYYCVVTATREQDRKHTTSLVATVTVKKPPLQAPTIDAQPQDIVLDYGEEGSLTVKATSSTGDTLSYQWYQASDQSDNQKGTPIEDATKETLAVGQGAEPGNYYYYCVVTATRGSESLFKTSRVATVTVKKPLLQAPTITAEPEDIVLDYGKEGSLTVKATSSTGDTLTYQWYKANDKNNTKNGTELEGEISETLAVGQGAEPGNYYYYCVVIATRDGESLPTTSDVATVTVKKPLLQAPTIDAQPQDLVLDYGKEGSLTVKAKSPTGDTLSYQWYQASDKNNTQNGTELEGATNETLAISKDTQPGNYYYYCVVTATRDGELQPTTSRVATVTVKNPPAPPSLPSPTPPGEMVTNPDGSVTTTVTKPDGTTVATTRYPNGDTLILTTAANGVTKADLQGSEECLASLPMDGIGPHIVAMVTDANGVRRLETHAIATRYGMVLRVHDGDVIELVHQDVSFVDVTDSHWAKDSVAFTAARDLMVGVDATHFAPEVSTTRAMIWSILARMDGATFAVSDPWYEGSREWAVANGVSDGTNPSAGITREQLAAMLYRFAGSPSASASLGDFEDADTISHWALDGMIWAVQEGLLSGIDDNTLAPQASCSRAQTAAILERFIVWQLGISHYF